MPLNILVTAPTLASSGTDLFDAHDARVLYADTVEAVEAVLAEEPIDAVLSRTLPLSGAAMRSCPTLKIVSKHGVGVDNVDVAAATALRIPVFNTPGCNARSVAELTIGMMVAVARKLEILNRELHAGRWTRLQDGMELSGRTLGVVGLGRVGSKVARIALAMEMKVIACDPAYGLVSPVPGVEMVDELMTLCRRAEVLSLHVPLTPVTRDFIGRDQIAALPEGAILINAGRGEILVEAALVEALKSGHLRGAALDVLPEEPLRADSPLRGLSNLVMTPHIGGSTPAALGAIAGAAATHIFDLLNEGRFDASACINPQVLPA